MEERERERKEGRKEGREGMEGRERERKGKEMTRRIERNLELRVNSNYVRIYSAKWQVNRQKITPRQT